MTKMTKEEKINAMIGYTGLFIIFLIFLFRTTIFPYIAVKKAEKGEFKTDCAYVAEKIKVKYSYDYYMMIDREIYTDKEIFPIRDMSFLESEAWNNFPIRFKKKDFFIIEPTVCKKVKYVEVYNILGFKKIYLYDFIQ